MKYQKSRIRQIVLLLIVVVFAAPVLSGCHVLGSLGKTVNRVDYPFQRAEKRAKAKNPLNADKEHFVDVQPTDRDIVSFSAEMIQVLGIEARNYRYIRKITTTLGVISGVIATSIHGAIGANADTVTMFAAAYTITPLLQQIWGAGEASQAKQKGIKLITDAQGRYYGNLGTAGGSLNNTRITTAGAQLYKEVLAALTVVGDAIAKQIPNLKDLQIAEGISNVFALNVVPRRISMLRGVAAAPGVPAVPAVAAGLGVAAVPAVPAVPAVTAMPSIRYISIVGDFAVTANSDNPSVVDVTGFTPNSNLIKITASNVNNGIATISISNAKGDKATVFVKVGNRAPNANAGKNYTVSKGDPVILNAGQSSDTDGDTLIYLWSLTSAGNVKLNDPTSVNPTFVTDKTSGSYRATVTVSDGAESDTKSVTITAQ